VFFYPTPHNKGIGNTKAGIHLEEIKEFSELERIERSLRKGETKNLSPVKFLNLYS
jgi:hypothetical protein